MEILFLYLLIYSFLAVLGLHCCAGNSLVAVYRLLVAVASLIAEHRLWGADFHSCDARAGKLHFPSCRTQAEC